MLSLEVFKEWLNEKGLGEVGEGIAAVSGNPDDVRSDVGICD